MKRLLAFLLLLLVSVTTITPCCVMDDCATQIADGPGNKEESDADCSPFFACSGCAGFVETTKTLHLEGPVSYLQAYYEHVYKTPVNSFYNSFWQPPRLT